MSGYKIYLQKFGQEFTNDYVYAAYEGFDAKRAYPIHSFEDIEEVPVRKNNVVVGFIEDTVKYFEKLGIKIPEPLNIPDEIKEYCKRNMNITTMGDFKKSTELPIFVKPYEKLKVFPSGVIKKQSSRETLFNDVPDSFKVLTSEVVEMVTEYRGFVRKGKLVGLKQYIGDFTIFPDVNVINECISKYKSAPSAYTIDFAVTDKNETVLIECNDGWAVGSYGLDGEIYADFLLTRWVELMRE